MAKGCKNINNPQFFLLSFICFGSTRHLENVCLGIIIGKTAPQVSVSHLHRSQYELSTLGRSKARTYKRKKNRNQGLEKKRCGLALEENKQEEGWEEKDVTKDGENKGLISSKEKSKAKHLFCLFCLQAIFFLCCYCLLGRRERNRVLLTCFCLIWFNFTFLFFGFVLGVFFSLGSLHNLFLAALSLVSRRRVFVSQASNISLFTFAGCTPVLT